LTLEGCGYAPRCDNQFRDGLLFAENARPALIFVLLPILAGHPIKRGSNHRSIQQNAATSSMVHGRTGTETTLNELTGNRSPFHRMQLQLGIALTQYES